MKNSAIIRFISIFHAAAMLLAVATIMPISTARAQFADQATYIGTPGGTANAITLAVPNWTRNLSGVPIRFIPGDMNTGATTVVVNGVGSAIAIKKQTGNGLAALSGGELVTTEIASIVFDGTQWQLGPAPPPAPEPQGYLTPCQVSSPSPISGCTVGQIVPTTSVSAATTLYYEGYNGNLVPIFNGAQFVPTPVTESQMTLILSTTANLANHIYDVCVYNNAGTPAIGTAVGWSTFTVGSGARGTGAGTAEIVKVNGLWVNANTMNVTNNNVTVSVPANKCTVVASIYIDSSNGQVSLHRNTGQSRKWGVFNFYNRQPITLQMQDGTGTWTVSNAGWGPTNGSANNVAYFFSGLPDETGHGIYTQNSMNNSSNMNSYNAIGLNANNAFNCGTQGQNGISSGDQVASITMTAVCDMLPQIGVTSFNAMQTRDTSSAAFSGSQGMMMRVYWRG